MSPSEWMSLAAIVLSAYSFVQVRRSRRHLERYLALRAQREARESSPSPR